MTRFLSRAAVVSISLAVLAAVPAAALRTIEEGVDYWRTPPGGGTFEFPPGDVEALCHHSPDPSWIHTASFEGVPFKSDWDSAVARLTDAHFNKDNVAYTRVRFKFLDLKTTAPSVTPCGTLNFRARLAKGKQPITKMKITRSSPQAEGGLFFADLALRVEIVATEVGGREVGKLFYDIKLPDANKGKGTPWSYVGRFRAGMDTANNCLKVEREELLNTPTTSDHFYFISNAIAQGKCVHPEN